MNQKLKNGDRYVMAKMYYRDPKTNQDFTVIRTWPCKDDTDAEQIVKYYGMKTGAYTAECVMEVYDEEIIRKRIEEAKEIAAKENQTASEAQECAV
jgi:hypothetical protein